MTIRSVRPPLPNFPYEVRARLDRRQRYWLATVHYKGRCANISAPTRAELNYRAELVATALIKANLQEEWHDELRKLAAALRHPQVQQRAVLAMLGLFLGLWLILRALFG